jgi:hypothetical protein
LWCTVCYGVDWRKERREIERERWIPARCEKPKRALHDACLVKCAGCALSSSSEGTSIHDSFVSFVFQRKFFFERILFISVRFFKFYFILFFFIQFSFPFTKVEYKFI